MDAAIWVKEIYISALSAERSEDLIKAAFGTIYRAAEVLLLIISCSLGSFVQTECWSLYNHSVSWKMAFERRTKVALLTFHVCIYVLLQLPSGSDL